MASTTAQYEALADQIEAVLQHSEAPTQIKDKRLRRRLAEGGRKLGISFEEPGDTLRRLGYMVIMVSILPDNKPFTKPFHQDLVVTFLQHFQLPLVCIGVETSIFKTVAAAPQKAFTNAELAERTGVKPKLLSECFPAYLGKSD